MADIITDTNYNNNLNISSHGRMVIQLIHRNILIIDNRNNIYVREIYLY